MKKYATIEEFLNDLSPDALLQVNALRKIIKGSADVEEHIKWNAPSYVYDGEDRITFNMHGTDIKVLIHMGAVKKEDKSAPPVMADQSGLITWNSNIRGTISFSSMDDIKLKRQAFTGIIDRWLKYS